MKGKEIVAFRGMVLLCVVPCLLMGCSSESTSVDGKKWYWLSYKSKQPVDKDGRERSAVELVQETISEWDYVEHYNSGTAEKSGLDFVPTDRDVHFVHAVLSKSSNPRIPDLVLDLSNKLFAVKVWELENIQTLGAAADSYGDVRSMWLAIFQPGEEERMEKALECLRSLPEKLEATNVIQWASLKLEFDRPGTSGFGVLFSFDSIAERDKCFSSEPFMELKKLSEMQPELDYIVD